MEHFLTRRTSRWAEVVSRDLEAGKEWSGGKRIRGSQGSSASGWREEKCGNGSQRTD